MKPEITYLAAVAALTALMWIPYVLDRFATWGISATVGYPDNPPPQSPWARRMKAAHANAIENLAVFGVLVLAADSLNVSGSATAMAAMLYFWSRVVHAVAYTFALPWIRTLAFTGGFVAQMVYAWQILGR